MYPKLPAASTWFISFIRPVKPFCFFRAGFFFFPKCFFPLSLSSDPLLRGVQSPLSPLIRPGLVFNPGLQAIPSLFFL